MSVVLPITMFARSFSDKSQWLFGESVDESLALLRVQRSAAGRRARARRGAGAGAGAAAVRAAERHRGAARQGDPDLGLRARQAAAGDGGAGAALWARILRLHRGGRAGRGAVPAGRARRRPGEAAVRRLSVV